MERYAISVVVLFVFAASALAAQEAHIKPLDVAGQPRVFCQVVKEPDPQLMGGWKCVWARPLEKTHDFDTNPVEYWLVKRGDRYALYFYRTKEDGIIKKYIGWKDWVINGTEINSDTGVKLFTKDGGVYFKWKQDTPIKMERIESQ